MNAIHDWEQTMWAQAEYIVKGDDWRTEHYSIFQADVPVPDNPKTGLNTDLIQALSTYDKIAIVGEASSHCLRFSVTDLVNNFGVDNIKNLYILEDCTSPIQMGDCPEQARKFMEEMKSKGVNIVRSADFF
jgi:nicotinamidase-related amidase